MILWKQQEFEGTFKLNYIDKQNSGQGVNTLRKSCPAEDTGHQQHPGHPAAVAAHPTVPSPPHTPGNNYSDPSQHSCFSAQVFKVHLKREDTRAGEVPRVSHSHTILQLPDPCPVFHSTLLHFFFPVPVKQRWLYALLTTHVLLILKDSCKD